jgi:hypothetical protein
MQILPRVLASVEVGSEIEMGTEKLIESSIISTLHTERNNSCFTSSVNHACIILS